MLRAERQRVEADIPVRTTLADCIRHHFMQTGTHVGCEHGVCGACTVIVDGEAVRSCLMLAVQADGSKVTTVEGLTPPRVFLRSRRRFASITRCSAASVRPVF